MSKFLDLDILNCFGIWTLIFVIMNNNIVILAGNYESTNVVYHALKNDFNIVKVIREEKVPRLELIKKRLKKLGFWRVIGQVKFMVLAVPLLEYFSRERSAEIKNKFGLDDRPTDENKLLKVKSVNADEVIAELKRIDPAVVVINGTRIITERVLNSCQAKFINMHAGITPAYRGSHGAYWALVHRDPAKAGVTVHLVDKGIDTGAIIAQAKIAPESADNFMTYPWLQTAAGLPLLKRAIREALNGELQLKPASAGPSALWSHPTIWEYLRHRVKDGVK